MTKQELKRSDKMNKTLDVWAIQKHPEELYTALENIKTDQGDLILFTNLNSNFQLNGQTVGRQFDTELYYVGKDNDALILLQKDGEASAEQIRNYLEERGLQYHEVSFKKEMLKQQLEELDIIKVEQSVIVLTKKYKENKRYQVYGKILTVPKIANIELQKKEKTNQPVSLREI